MVSRTPEHSTSVLAAVSNALVALHKEQFGRGPTTARSHFAGPDSLVCILEDVMVPAERKMIAMGEGQRVCDSRMAFQVATTEEFVAAIEQIVQRKVRSFASATDVEHDVVFENFAFEPQPARRRTRSAGLGHGAASKDSTSRTPARSKTLLTAGGPSITVIRTSGRRPYSSSR